MISSDVQEEIEKREEFKNILLELAQSEDLLQDRSKRRTMYIRLEALYYSPVEGKEFRHFYSDIFLTLTVIKKQPEKLGDIDVLGQNLSYLRENYQAKNTDQSGKLIDISKSLQKLLDHVSLDIARIEYSELGDRETSQKDHILNLSKQVELLQAANDDAKKKQDQLKDKIANQQREYIAILGIFAAVVLTFNAAIAYSSSVFQNLANISIYRLVAISLIIGLVVIAILSLLFFFIDRIVNFKEEKKPIFAITVSIVLGIFLIITSVLWWNGIVEQRNATINGTSQTTTKSP